MMRARCVEPGVGAAASIATIATWRLLQGLCCTNASSPDPDRDRTAIVAATRPEKPATRPLASLLFGLSMLFAAFPASAADCRATGGTKGYGSHSNFQHYAQPQGMGGSGSTRRGAFAFWLNPDLVG